VHSTLQCGFNSSLQCDFVSTLQCSHAAVYPPYLQCEFISSLQCDLVSAYSARTLQCIDPTCSVNLFPVCSAILFQPTVSPRCSASTLQCIAPTLKCEFISTLQCDLVPTLQSGLCHYVVQYGTEIRRTAVFIRFSTVYTVKYGTAYSTVQTLKASIN
jgi:hypothetical protein